MCVNAVVQAEWKPCSIDEFDLFWGLWSLSEDDGARLLSSGCWKWGTRRERLDVVVLV
jgi:hypothetical protein